MQKWKVQKSKYAAVDEMDEKEGYVDASLLGEGKYPSQDEAESSYDMLLEGGDSTAGERSEEAGEGADGPTHSTEFGDMEYPGKDKSVAHGELMAHDESADDGFAGDMKIESGEDQEMPIDKKMRMKFMKMRFEKLMNRSGPGKML